ncbi:MAG: hypothetical protein Terrestrivirus4_123 [Terrestrivirus sp.]|uniref:Uncharacterized protein n=1 Tax=Terrestrivirus sp. TaxID=2487775 RepID=A0A3G4ZMJ8_9VIRU|nr:MAG: hypothetical protein Terrestrivirus4_123 [Terrestrivirus sp.]
MATLIVTAQYGLSDLWHEVLYLSHRIRELDGVQSALTLIMDPPSPNFALMDRNELTQRMTHVTKRIKQFAEY